MAYVRSQSSFGGGKRAEAEIMRRSEAGQSRRQILDETDISASVVDKVLAGASDNELLRRKKDHLSGSRALLNAVRAEAAECVNRRRMARCTGTVTSPLEHQGSRTMLLFRLQQLLDVRPFATGRDPCSRCGARGDFGCKHQRPDEVIHARD